MRHNVGLLLAIFLCAPSVFSQRNDAYFKPTIALVSLEEAKQMDPDDVYHLKLKKNKSNTLPEEIFQFKNLRSLSVSGMKLDSLPEEIATFKKLEFIDFSKNNIETLPLTFCELKSLEIIVANQNPLAYLPYCLGNLINLVAIDLWDTEVSTLPESLEDVKSLKVVDFQGIELRQEEQDFLKKRFPDVKFRFDKPCNCFK